MYDNYLPIPPKYQVRAWRLLFDGTWRLSVSESVVGVAGRNWLET